MRASKPGRAFTLGLVAAGVLTACGSSNKPFPMTLSDDSGAPPVTTGLGGHIGGDGGINPGIGGSVGTLDAGAPSGTVSIMIQSPVADALLSTNAAADVAAKVTIMGGTDIIDPSSVHVALVPASITGMGAAAPLVGPVGDNLFSGKVSLDRLPTGDYTLTVTARSSTNVLGSASVKIKLDGGPKITVLSPVPGHHYKGSVIVQVIIDPGMFAPASAIAGSIAGTPLTLQPTGAPNVFRAVFDLTMPNQLSDDQLFEVSAKDSKGTLTDIKFVFNVDVAGPTITTPLPAPGAIVGQIIRLSATIVDTAGVDASSAQVLIGDKTNPQFKLPLTADGAGGFSTLFDTRLLTSCKLLPSQTLCIVRPTISFRAADALGNETTLSYEIAVDNLPPIADLVPPPIRVSKIADGLRCSYAFDPLSRNIYSGDAPDDNCRVPQLFDLRARIEDTGNVAAGIKQVPISGVDGDMTAAYILADTSQPLVVDVDGDGNCDTINPKLIPTTTPLNGPHQVLKVRMKPVPPAGAGDFRTDPSLMGNLSCPAGLETNPPPEICNVEQPTVAISYSSKLSSIWAVEPIAPDDPQYCFGSQIDTLANNVPESTGTNGSGWRCIAIATADKNGNLSTSMPIRVWVDFKYQGSFNWCDHPPATAGPMPSCTGTYDRATDILSPRACKARTFTPPPSPTNPTPTEVCFNNNCTYCGDFPTACN